MNWKSSIAVLGLVFAVGCNPIQTGSSAAAPAEEVLSRLKSIGLEIKSDNVMPPGAHIPWMVNLSEGVSAHRHLSTQAAKDFCWVQTNKNSPKACVTTNGWTVTWGDDTSPGVAGKLKQL